MITKELLDEVLPDTLETIKLAEVYSGLLLREDYGRMVIPDVVEVALKWMAKCTEDDRFWGYGDRKPAWKTNESAEWLYSIETGGLQYKPSSCYLTAEGWPTGTTCWYVCIESGWREYVGAETPRLAVIRALVVIGLAARLREIAPKERPVLADALLGLRKVQEAA